MMQDISDKLPRVNPHDVVAANFAVMFGAGGPPLPEEPTFHRHRPERGPDFNFYIVVGGLLIGSLVTNYIIHRLEINNGMGS